MRQDLSFSKPRRTGAAALAFAAALGLSLGAATMASAQTPAELELAQISSLTATCVNLINALPGGTTQEVYEAQLIAAIEASGMYGQLVNRALVEALKVRGLPPAAESAIRSVLSKGLQKRNLGTAALGDGGAPAFTNSFGGGGSDY